MAGARSLLVKESISDWLIDDIKGKVDENIISQLRSVTCQSKEEVKLLESVIKKLRRSIAPELYKALWEEFVEIREDNKWQGSARGQYVLAINSWFDQFRAEFSSIPEFRNAVVGGHATKKVVFVAGNVASKDAYDRLLDFIRSKRPPFKVLAKVAIGGA